MRFSTSLRHKTSALHPETRCSFCWGWNFVVAAPARTAVTNSSRDGLAETRYALIRRLSRNRGVPMARRAARNKMRDRGHQENANVHTLYPTGTNWTPLESDVRDRKYVKNG